jgi:hypothetical protein
MPTRNKEDEMGRLTQKERLRMGREISEWAEREGLNISDDALLLPMVFEVGLREAKRTGELVPAPRSTGNLIPFAPRRG